jgi:hypothetical protein
MVSIKTAMTTLAAGAILLGTVPAQAASPSLEAEKLRKLDIMLMVTALRCRTTTDNFQADFAAFEAAHLTELNGAAAQMRRDLVATAGPAGAARALDRLSTGMANQYGQGHPRLGCAQLKQTTRILTQTRGREALLSAADELLAPAETTTLALAR